MYFDTLPNEILTHIYLSLPSIATAVALSATCHRLNGAYNSSKKLVILKEAADAEFGPVQDIIQVLTYNSSQPAHIVRTAPISQALLRQIVKVGRIAQRVEDIYPFKKWKMDYGNRRLLTTDERYKLRRAIYRLWLYDSAFHNAAHVRTCRRTPEVVRDRAALLHNFTTSQIAEMLDVHGVLRDLVANNVCPSNGKIRQKFQKRFPDNNQHLLFNIHLNYPASPSTFVLDTSYHNSSFNPASRQSRLAPSRWQESGAEGWGDDISHYYVIEDMMKLDPEQILFLRDNYSLKAEVESYVKCLGDWFTNNGETFSETVDFVIRQRGGDVEELKLAIEEHEVGVVVIDD